MKIDGYVKTEEAAKLLDITEGRVRQLVADGTLVSEKFGNTRAISLESVRAYRANRRKAGWPKGKPRKTRG